MLARVELAIGFAATGMLVGVVLMLLLATLGAFGMAPQLGPAEAASRLIAFCGLGGGAASP